jgi:5,10-methenyltetrahydrofolate synthetase
VKTFNTLRQELLEKRMSLSHNAKTHQALEKILSDYLNQHTINCLGVYWPIKGEFDPRPCALNWAKQDPCRTLALPIVKIGAPLLYGTWNNSTSLTKGPQSIPEPIINEHSKITYPDVLLMPCLGWSYQNNRFWRIGYGGGYYDRTLAHHAQLQLATKALGLSFNQLEVKEGDWHPQPHDQPLDILLKI